MARRRTPLAIWATSALLGGVVALGIGLALVGLRAYWVAKYQGRKANLAGALLTGSDLRTANLTGTTLTHSLYNPTTRWPAGFDPAKHGAYRVGPGVHLKGADLHGALLGGNLELADLREANLQGAFLG